MRRLYIGLALIVLLSPIAWRVAAQSGVTVTLRHLETEAFPLIAGYMQARDSSGAYITDLQPSQLQALEDGQPRPIAQLRAVQPGLRIILVINPTESFNIRDSEGTTRFDHAKQLILDWASSLPSNSATSLSLITTEGILLVDEPAAAWVAAVELIQPDFPDQDVDPQTLVRSLELAAQPGVEPGMGTAIWWITSTPAVEALGELADWQNLLIEKGIPLFIWQIDSSSNFEIEPTGTLQNFTRGSGGQWFGFSSNEEFPEPEVYFSSLRSAYFFQYSSLLHTPGRHDVQLQMEFDGMLVTSQAISFELNLLPPNPVFVTPPAQIERSPSAQDPRLLAPFSQPVEVIVEFPDNFERNLLRSTLFVNEERVAENTSEPFTRFAWDISGYDISQQTLLRVEVEDELGLVGSSIEIPVQILVTNPPSTFTALLSRGGPVLALGGILLAAAAFFLVMVLSGRLKPTRISASLFRRHKPVARVIDPLSDFPLPTEVQEKPGQPPTIAAPLAHAYLQRLAIQDVDQGPQIFPIEKDLVLIGASKECGMILDEESVSHQHAQLTHAGGDYQIADLNSEAGTWVNYAPVSAEGIALRDGDLLHIGRVAFRFFSQQPSDSTESA